MTELLCVVYCIIGALTAIVLTVWAVVLQMSENAAGRREQRYARRFMQLIAARMLNGGAIPMARFPMCGRRGALAVLAHQLAAASASTCFGESGAIRRMVTANGIEGWLLRRVNRSRGYARARYMSMLASLPVSKATAEWVGRKLSDSDRLTRFRAMLVRIAADPAAAVRILGDYPLTLTHLEMAELTSMLRRGLLPLAYGPLVNSENVNLRMLGLNIIRIFGIAEAEESLCTVAAECGEERLCDEALFTLVSLRLPVSHRSIAARIRSMDAARRQRLFRRLASEGYSVEVLAQLACDGELEYAESLAASYKRTLLCRLRI